MKITRNGIEYELTESELRAAHWECQDLDLIEDIKCKMEEMGVDPDCIDVDSVLSNTKIEICIDNYLWASYWRDIEGTIDYYTQMNKLYYK